MHSVVRIADTTRAAAPSMPEKPPDAAEATPNVHFDRKAPKGGTPISASAASVKVAAVTGIFLWIPSMVWTYSRPLLCRIAPAQKKSVILITEW